MDVELHSILNMIPEIQLLEAEYRKRRNQARKALDKVKNAKSKYKFLERIVQPRFETDNKEDDIQLENAILDLFKSIGFKVEKPNDEADVDVKVRFKNFYFGIEVKNGNLVGENDTFQPLKHKILHDESFHPIVIFNNTKNMDNWGVERIKIANGGGFGLLLTTELQKGYIKLKKQKITFEQFLKSLQNTGEIKFSNKALERIL